MCQSWQLHLQHTVNDMDVMKVMNKQENESDE